MKLPVHFSQYLQTLSFCAVAGLSMPNLMGQTGVPGTTMTREQIIAEGEKLADAQLAQLAGKKPEIDWISGVMWAGYADFSHISSKPAYAHAIEQLGEGVRWTPQLRPKVPLHADDLCICQTFLDAYVTKKDPARLAASQSRIDAVCDFIQKSEKPDLPETWWWCDALFMAPASHARLAEITGDPKYLDAMDREWWKTTGLLYDKDEHLFYRDKKFPGKLDAKGKKIFWSRGNGWVFAGLARTLAYLPGNYPSRPRYVAMFKDMASRLASLQQPDGTWRPSLLDPDEFPDPETSGTSLDCFAYAWGINNGILDRAAFLPVAARAWAALLAARRPDGLLGYVQPKGLDPRAVKADDTQLYGTGAFLMSVCELSKLAPISLPPPPRLTILP
jgi:rhamnogalacturonyl hydrolase YesR